MRKFLLPLLLALVTLPALAQTKGEAMALVKRAIAYYKANGKGKMVFEVSKLDGQLRKGSLYVFVYDMNGKVVAHGQKVRMIGMDLKNAKDPAGKAFVQERIKIAMEKGSGWQDYLFENPFNHKVEEKSAYIERCDDLIFGCGTYKD